MKVLTFDNREDWLEHRRGKITGTRLKDLIVKSGTKKKKGFYEIIAERVAIPADGEFAMDRGSRLEDEAIQRFSKETGKKVSNKLEIWSREDNEDIAISPDGVIGKTEAVEVKCLNSASHIEAWLTQEIPSEYEYQVLQYFVVHDKLEKLHFVFFDPRMPKDFFFITKTRDELEDQIAYCLDLEKKTLQEIDQIVMSLTF